MAPYRIVRRLRAALPLTALLVGLAQPALAGNYETDTLIIEAPVSYPTRPGMKVGGVFFARVAPKGAEGDRLVAAATPIAGIVELHRMQMIDDTMRMRAVDGIDITADAPVSFRRGESDSYHLMLFELQAPLKTGDRFPVTLRFERAGEVAIEVDVVDAPTPGMGGGHGGHMGHGKGMHQGGKRE